MSFTVIIPARYASTRLPGKPLLPIAGRPMLEHVYLRACRSSAREVIVATDDARIEQTARAFGAKVCMTSPHHPSGTDRLQEVTKMLELEPDQLVVNVQGDEPLIPPAIIDQVAALLAGAPEAGMATLAEPINRTADLFNPNIVKLVTDALGNALYFSRAPIPWARDSFAAGSSQDVETEFLTTKFPFQRHIGIYAYRVAFLNAFVGWSPAPLESCEALEQLRALWQGARIKVAAALEAPPAGVDTLADLERVRALLESAQVR